MKAKCARYSKAIPSNKNKVLLISHGCNRSCLRFKGIIRFTTVAYDCDLVGFATCNRLHHLYSDLKLRLIPWSHPVQYDPFFISMITQAELL